VLNVREKFLIPPLVTAINAGWTLPMIERLGSAKIDRATCKLSGVEVRY
jgi:hypothetical protein